MTGPAPGEDAFAAAVASVRAVTPRPEIRLEEVPAPARLAPYSIALTAEVVPDDRDADDREGDDELGTGRFVLLHEPAGHDAWDGSWRVVTFARADLEPDLADDPLLSGIGWAWLLESLQAHGIEPHALGGTVTRVGSESFGTMAERPAQGEIEVRASWTPVPSRGLDGAHLDGANLDGAHLDSAGLGSPGLDLGAHLRAWLDLLATCAGLPPLPDGVVALPSARRR